MSLLTRLLLVSIDQIIIVGFVILLGAAACIIVVRIAAWWFEMLCPECGSRLGLTRTGASNPGLTRVEWRCNRCRCLFWRKRKSDLGDQISRAWSNPSVGGDDGGDGGDGGGNGGGNGGG